MIFAIRIVKVDEVTLDRVELEGTLDLSEASVGAALTDDHIAILLRIEVTVNSTKNLRLYVSQ